MKELIDKNKDKYPYLENHIRDLILRYELLGDISSLEDRELENNLILMRIISLAVLFLQLDKMPHLFIDNENE